jgi:predicted nucleic acid-binding protein
MITAVDTNVLLDVFTDDPTFGAGSLAALRACLAEGSLVACDVVWAELIAAFPDPGMRRTGRSRRSPSPTSRSGASLRLERDKPGGGIDVPAGRGSA